MLWICRHISQAVPQPPLLRQRLGTAIQAFWRFSQFYGEYQSRPPQQRRQFVLDSCDQQRSPDSPNRHL